MPDMLAHHEVAEAAAHVRDAFPAAPVVGASDSVAVYALCRAYQVMDDALADHERRGVSIESSRADREQVRNPSVMVMHAALERWHRLAAGFGLTPADRARFHAPKVDEDADPLAEILAEAKADRERIRTRRQRARRLT